MNQQIIKITQPKLCIQFLLCNSINTTWHCDAGSYPFTLHFGIIGIDIDNAVFGYTFMIGLNQTSCIGSPLVYIAIS